MQSDRRCIWFSIDYTTEISSILCIVYLGGMMGAGFRTAAQKGPPKRDGQLVPTIQHARSNALLTLDILDSLCSATVIRICRANPMPGPNASLAKAEDQSKRRGVARRGGFRKRPSGSGVPNSDQSGASSPETECLPLGCASTPSFPRLQQSSRWAHIQDGLLRIVIRSASAGSRLAPTVCRSKDVPG